jgi:hypothetical protein
MNLDKLKRAEEEFLFHYPGGFDHPEIIMIRTKRHNVDKMITFARDSFARPNFQQPALIVQSLSRLISQSSIISRYEKPRFRDFVEALPFEEQRRLAEVLQELLHGDEKTSLEILMGMLNTQKLAKWTLLTAGPAYFHPQRDVLVKPTTVKGIIEHFELDGLHYTPAPSWAFYESYRSAIHEMKSHVDPSLSPSNIAFSWFLLLSIHRDLF